MIKTSASKFKSKLGQFMRAVREGKEVLVTDRDQPVAKLVPVRPANPSPAIHVSGPRDPASPSLGRIVVAGIKHRSTDTTSMLREDRDRR